MQPSEQSPGYVGRSLIRKDAAGKVSGRARYADDITLPGMLWARVVRSPVAAGRIRGCTPDPAFDWSGITVVTAADIPGRNIVASLVEDMPLLATDEVFYAGEPLALVAAESPERAAAAAANFKIEIDPLTPLLTLEEALRRESEGEEVPLLCRQSIVKGDVQAGFERAHKVVEGTYSAGHQEQLYLETQAMIAVPDDGGILIEGSMQCPYYVHPELCVILGLPPEKVRVRQAVVGGAFGGKEDFPTLIAGYCALLALKSGRPVKMVFDRNEDILFTTKRHPCRVRHRTGLAADGTITAWEVSYALDGGAYTTLSPVVMARGIIHAVIGYRCENVFIEGRVYRTNTPPAGAFRGFGAPQALWALESHVDRLAEAVGLTPAEFRLRNIYHPGDTTATGQVVDKDYGGEKVVREALAASDFSAKLSRCTHGRSGAQKWYGVGLAFFCHGAGFTGDGEARIHARAAVELDADAAGEPRVIVRVSSTEMGQGSQEVLSQIAADALGADREHVDCPFPDTAFVPDSGPTVASRTTMVVGHTVHAAARKLKRRLEEFAADTYFGGKPTQLVADVFRTDEGDGRPFAQVALDYLQRSGSVREESAFELPPGYRWDPETFRGQAYPAYSLGCNVAEVEVDPRTLQVRVVRVSACFDIGRVINPLQAEAQVHGGLTQALGYALMEKIGVRENGRFDAERLQTYIIPTALDVPEYDVRFVEFPYEYAEPGAKGLGELPMDGLAAAIANAVKAATGVRVCELPITPEKLLEALHPQGSAREEDAQ